MNNSPNSARRSFLKSGALLAVPLAAAAPAAVLADDGLKARLTRLENEVAIRQLHQTWLRRVNSATGDDAVRLLTECEAVDGRGVRSIATDHREKPDVIEVAADGRSGTGRFPCVVEIETAIAPDCTLAQMAHAQGGGFVRRTEHRVLKVEYVRASGAWAIAKIEFASA